MNQLMLLVLVSVVFGLVAAGVVWYSWTILEKVLYPDPDVEPSESSKMSRSDEKPKK